MPDAPPQVLSHYPAQPPPRRVRLVGLGEHACPYLPGRVANNRALWAESMEPATYRAFMDAGFRRSGKLLYQPVCGGCRSCQPIRVSVAAFRPDKSQRRCWRGNSDLRIRCGMPQATAEKYELYCRYVRDWHGKASEDGIGAFEAFLYDSPVQTIEFEYRTPSGRLLAVGICDVCPGALSSVYFYFDPEEARRGLGTFGALEEIAFAKKEDIEYYYLGYWVSGCPSMEYKAGYRPSQILDGDGVWRPRNEP